MIQSAMVFALGAFASGLLWLGIAVALVRRARRLTERRLLAGIAVRRAEFESERDELRARHAIQLYRLEREVGRVLDMATAHRLEADLKERDLVNARAELLADEEDFRDIERRLAAERKVIQELERRHADVGAQLRAAQHALGLEQKRRATTEDALDDVTMLADQRRQALIALRGENDDLRFRLGEEPGAPSAFELEPSRSRPAVPRRVAEPEPQLGASIVALPTREPRPQGDRAAAQRTPGVSAPSEVVALRGGEPAEPQGDAASAETRFFEALAEIRALKRTANVAGE